MKRAGHACHPPCEGRAVAQSSGEFLYVARMGWLFVDAPKLRNGWPIVRVECPWCGGDLEPPDMGEGAE